MQKIPTLFVRDWENRRHVLDQVTPGCEWVLTDPRAVPTRMWDGACVMLDDNGMWWARRKVKRGKTSPSNYRPLYTDSHSGTTVGWEPAIQSPFVLYHLEALPNSDASTPGTYELLGPKINGNRDVFADHILVPHDWAPLSERLDLSTAPRDYTGLKDWLLSRPYKGIVWTHPDGRRAKLKASNFPRQAGQ